MKLVNELKRLVPRFICRHCNSLMRIRKHTTGSYNEWTYQCSSCLRWFDGPDFGLSVEELIDGLARAKIVVEKRF